MIREYLISFNGALIGRAHFCDVGIDEFGSLIAVAGIAGELASDVGPVGTLMIAAFDEKRRFVYSKNFPEAKCFLRFDRADGVVILQFRQEPRKDVFTISDQPDA